MKLQNVTAVLLARTEGNVGFKVVRIIENPELPSKNGKPCIGPYLRRLLTVKEVVAKTGMSKSKAADARRANPISFLADFEGQTPLMGAVAA